MKVRLAIGLLAFGVPVAFAQQKNAACIAAYEQGQVDRRAGHFDVARRDFSTCTEDGCPTVVRERCVQFARDLEAVQPTIIVVVRDRTGRDVSGARIALDGAVFEPIPAAALRIDPGEHVIRVETEVGAAEQHIVLREGEKDRRIEITAGESASGTRIAPATRKPVDVWVMTITAGVAFVGAGALSAAGWGIYSNLSSTCHDACSEDKVAPLRVLWPAAFAALGVGVVAGVIAGVLFAVDARRAEHSAVWITPAGVAGTF